MSAFSNAAEREKRSHFCCIIIKASLRYALIHNTKKGEFLEHFTTAVALIQDFFSKFWTNYKVF